MARRSRFGSRAKFLTAESEYGYGRRRGRPDIDARPAGEYGPLLVARGAFRPNDRRLVNPNIKAVARVEHSRWLVDCPLTDPARDDEPCRGAQFASKTDPRLWCVDCKNAAVGGQWLEVVWPSDSMVRAIERSLGKRPRKLNRNWYPHESRTQLEAENRLMGVV
jgi:hypothetical protein